MYNFKFNQLLEALDCYGKLETSLE